MLIAGLTGSIATGKSTVSNFFRELGAIIIDADEIAKRAVEKGMPAYDEIVRKFGNEILLADGCIDRSKLGDIVFNDSGKRSLLNSIVHPEVFRVMSEEMKAAQENFPSGVAILDVPLLIESGIYKNLPEVILVYVPVEIQLKRLMQRDASDRQAALSRIKAQMSIEKKKEFATIIIDNSFGLEQTKLWTEEVFQELIKKALA